MSTATLDFNQPAQCHRSQGTGRCKNYTAWQNPSKMSENSRHSLHNLFHKMFCFFGCTWRCSRLRRSCSSAATGWRRTSQKMCFLGWSLVRFVFDALSVGESRPGSFAALQAQGSSLALAFHTRSAVKACDRPQTLQPTAPLYPRPCCLANYGYSAAMKVIPSDMQLSGQIVSALLFVAFEGRLSQGRDRSPPLLSDFDMYDQNWV